MWAKKAHTFLWRNKNVRKRTKADEKGLQCKSTLIDSICSNCTRLRYETNTICYSKQIITLPISKQKIIDFLSKILTFIKMRIAQPRASAENFSGGPIRINLVSTTKNGRIFEIWKV